MFSSLNNWLFTLSTFECFILVYMVITAIPVAWSSVVRVVVLNDKLFGDGDYTLTISVGWIVMEIVFWVSLFYFNR